jgi:hypothetical protein
MLCLRGQNFIFRSGDELYASKAQRMTKQDPYFDWLQAGVNLDAPQGGSKRQSSEPAGKPRGDYISTLVGNFVGTPGEAALPRLLPGISASLDHAMLFYPTRRKVLQPSAMASAANHSRDHCGIDRPSIGA